MKITALKKQQKNPDRVSVFVDSKYEFSLSLSELLDSKLKLGHELQEQDIKKFKKISEDGKLRGRSLEWLLNRPRSTREFKDYLYRKKADPQLSEKLIEEFSNRGYLDDVKFAEWFSELLTRRNKSPRAIKAELMRKGIAAETAESIMRTQEIDEDQAIRAMVEKKKKLSRYKNDPIKLARYLTSQGFSYSKVREHVKDI